MSRPADTTQRRGKGGGSKKEGRANGQQEEAEGEAEIPRTIRG